MSDPSTPSKAKGGWTEAEKLGILFQIIEKTGKIPWSDIDLPEGRTLKAVQVMVDKEKSKVRKAKEVRNGDGEEAEAADGSGVHGKTPKSNKVKKRTAEELDGDDDNDDGNRKASPKKTKSPSKKMIKKEQSTDSAE